MTKHGNFLKIAQITDLHLQAQPHGRLWDVDVDQGLTAVLEHMTNQHWPLDFILATGDLVQDDAAAYMRLRNFLEPLGVPVYCLPGNHDMPEQMATLLNTGLVCHKRHIIDDNWQFILLNSVVQSSPAGYVSHEELKFLEYTLQMHPKQHAMICLHHPPVLIGSSWLDSMASNGEDLFAVLDRHPQVRAVVWGHIHQAYSAQRHGVELLGAPSTCLQFKPAVAGAEADAIPPGYRWFELYADGSLRTRVERVAKAY